MTAEQLKTIEAELQKRGYKKWTTALTSTESYAWFKTFGKKQNDDGWTIDGYQIAFRVWDFQKYKDRNVPDYGFDFWTSALGADSRMDFTSNWEPICDITIFEQMAEDFHQLTKKYLQDNGNK